ncbi:MAG TPA: peptidoglycan DD-metalloendopeptidase family protein [Clostridia bacterium]|nr:peptidoglycan DD-metalloendopeptidase family protein [Clostridia bacterium]
MKIYALALVFCLIAGFIIGMADANTRFMMLTQKMEKEEGAAEALNSGTRQHTTADVSPYTARVSPSQPSSPKASLGESGTPPEADEPDSPEEVVPAFSQRTEPLVITHTVRRGETLSSIAKTYGTDTKSIAYINKLGDPDVIEAGRKLKVLTRPGVFRRVKPGDTLWSLSLEHQAEVEDVISINGISDPDLIAPGDLLLLPRAVPQNGRAGRNAFITSVSRRSRPELTGFIWPLAGPITSPFGPRWGRMHYGVDIAAPVGTKVVAAKDGKVAHSGWYGSYGKVVILDHGDGVQTVYAHLSSISDQTARRGDVVRQNQVIGRVGNTGFSLGPHLHFEIRSYGRPVDPLTLLPTP